MRINAGKPQISHQETWAALVPYCKRGKRVPVTLKMVLVSLFLSSQGKGASCSSYLL